MIIGIPKETTQGENRVAANPATVKGLLKLGIDKVIVERAAGEKSFISDEDYVDSGANIVSNVEELYRQSKLILKVRNPETAELDLLNENHVVIGLLQPHDKKKLASLAEKGVVGLAMEKLPRISRAQSMDVLSSQANLAGYRAVLAAANEYTRLMPMLMTAAGTIKAARCVVMGVGVAGLQAIATAKRLGCIVEATDVRPETKEQVESLGAKFIEVPNPKDKVDDGSPKASVYATEMSEEYKKKQTGLVSKRVEQADIVITTALIPGKPAPILVTKAMVESMRPGSVIVDLAVEQGGNCPLSELNKTILHNQVAIIGISNLPSLLASDASALYSRNILNFVELLITKDEGEFVLNREDEIVEETLVCLNGKPK